MFQNDWDGKVFVTLKKDPPTFAFQLLNLNNVSCAIIQLHRKVSRTMGYVAPATVASPKRLALKVLIGWISVTMTASAGDELNFDAEYGSQCLRLYDNDQCTGTPVVTNCEDLGEEDACYTLAPLNGCNFYDGLYANQTCVRWDAVESTGASTTTTTTTANLTTTTTEQCLDTTWEEHLGYALWTDAWNFTCADYETFNWCSKLVNYSYSTNERGCTAAQACCFCGGGTTGGNQFIHEDQVTETPEYMEDCSNYEFELDYLCRSFGDDGGQPCTLTCRTIWQSFCGQVEANYSGYAEGNLSARQACCRCGGGDKPPEPYIVYDTTTCTFFSYNITPDGTSEILYDAEGFQYQISYSRSNPPACWTGLAFLILGGVFTIAIIGFLIYRVIDARRHTKVNVANRNRLPRQSVMEVKVIARKRELFEAEQQAEELEEIERQRILRNQKADEWLTKAKEDGQERFQRKWEEDQRKRNAASRRARAAPASGPTKQQS
mgnify:CR=1 FL=1